MYYKKRNVPAVVMILYLGTVIVDLIKTDLRHHKDKKELGL